MISTARSNIIVLAAVAMMAAVAFFFFRPTEKAVEAPTEVAPAQEVAVTEPTPVEVTEEQKQVAQVPTTPEPADNLPPKIKLLKSILDSRNDNDSRLDTELKVLDSETKEQLKEYYKARQPEDRNGRGTIVFLLGRNISSVEDIGFFEEVLAESPCLSMADCSRQELSLGTHDEQHDTSQDVTLAYPKLVALNMFERVLESGTVNRDMREALWRALGVAEKSPEPKVSQRAKELRGRIGL